MVSVPLWNTDPLYFMFKSLQITMFLIICLNPHVYKSEQSTTRMLFQRTFSHPDPQAVTSAYAVCLPLLVLHSQEVTYPNTITYAHTMQTFDVIHLKGDLDVHIRLLHQYIKPVNPILLTTVGIFC